MGHPLRQRLLVGTPYSVAPYVNQADMFDAVFRGLADGEWIGIFPEGGSHDRPNLLPLKAGAAVIALGTLARDPHCKLTILPCGMSYFNPHKFRSRAVVEFGDPVQVDPKQVIAFKQGGASKRNAVESLLQMIQNALAAVTQQAPDYETLMLIQATRRLYRPLRTKLPLPVVVEMNRRLIAGYTRYKDEPRVVQLGKAVSDYNLKLRALGIKDHQVEWGNARQRPRWLAFLTLLYRIGQFVTLGTATLPSLALFWPVFVTAKIITVRKQRNALAASVVKLEGRDVVGTLKILVAMGLAPMLYIWYTVVVSLWLHHCRQNGYYATLAPWWSRADTYVTDGISLKFFSTAFFGFLITITFAGLRIGEIGVDIIKSLPPLFIALSPKSANTLAELRAQRESLSSRVVDAIDALGPELFPNLDLAKPNHDIQEDSTYESGAESMPTSRPRSPVHSGTMRCHVRSSSSGGSSYYPYYGSSKALAITMKDDLGEVNRRFMDSTQSDDQDSCIRIGTKLGLSGTIGVALEEKKLV